jgi:ubiquinone/menaquinone biosynthesis C-methylase UbiE
MSDLLAQIAWVPRPLVCAAADAWYRVRGVDQLVPPARLRLRVGCYPAFLSADKYLEIGVEFMRVFATMAPLRRSTRMLDIGCGCGQVAVPMAKIIGSTGSYDGFDPERELIEWCRREIESRFRNFRFAHADLRSSLYNPPGAILPEEFTFPYNGASFDVILLKSVFTHMTLAGVEQYFREIRRMLAPGGVCVASFFLLNDEAESLIAAGRSRFDLPWRYKNHWLQDDKVPEFAVAFREQRIRELASAAGLHVVGGIRYGGWCGRTQFTSFQDLAALAAREDPAVAQQKVCD